MVTALPNVQLQNKVQEFISKPRKMLIDGKWVESASGKTFPTYDPSTGEVLAKVAEGDREDIDRALQIIADVLGPALRAKNKLRARQV